MSQHDKLVRRLQGIPSDFAWEEMVRLLKGFGYNEMPNAGGSHRKFQHAQSGVIISGLVKPHQPRKHVAKGYLRMVLEHLGLE